MLFLSTWRQMYLTWLLSRSSLRTMSVWAFILLSIIGPFNPINWYTNSEMILKESDSSSSKCPMLRCGQLLVKTLSRSYYNIVIGWLDSYRCMSRRRYIPGVFLLKTSSSKVTKNIDLDLILQPETQRNMQSAAIQRRLSEATIIEAQANVETAKMMKETSEILNAQSAMQIRYL